MTAILAVTALYGAFLIVGWLATRRQGAGTIADFMVAGRGLPLWLATFTMTATWVDGGYLLGTAEGAYRDSVASGLQGGVCFGISLILGGLFFARRMRALGFNTLIDPFEARYGARWAVVLSLPAMLAETFWSAELLVALGTTFGVVLGVDLVPAILASAAIVTVYTMAGGMWAVAYTDAFQLALVVIGLAVAVPIALDAVGGLQQAWGQYVSARGDAASPVPFVGNMWSFERVVSWWDVSAMLMLGGIPWNCYFQRVLSCRSMRAAQMHSIFSGVLTLALTVPPLLLGIAAFAYPWPAEIAAQLAVRPADAVPLIFRHVLPPALGIVALAAVIGAVTSSFSSSILSASAMFSWNTCARLLAPQLPLARLQTIMRVTIGVIAVGAVWMALEVQSVQALWFFTSDLVFVLLFPQLVAALFDAKANVAGSMVAFTVSLVLRLGGGEPLFGVAPVIPYPEIASWLLPIDAARWYTEDGFLLFPYKSLAAVTGLVLLPVVSRATPSWSAPRALRNVAQVSR